MHSLTGQGPVTYDCMMKYTFICLSQKKYNRFVRYEVLTIMVMHIPVLWNMSTHPEDVGSNLLWNVCTYIPISTFVILQKTGTLKRNMDTSCDCGSSNQTP